MEGGTPVGMNYGCYHMYGFYDAFGGKIFDPSWKVIADQGTGVTDTFTYLNDLYQISKKNGWALNDSDGLAPFSEGKLAAIMNGNWAMGDYRKALGDKLGVVPLPAGPAGPATPMLGVDGFYFSPNSQNMDAALQVALYLTNADFADRDDERGWSRTGAHRCDYYRSPHPGTRRRFQQGRDHSPAGS